MRLSGEQIGPLGVSKNHAKLSDLLEFRQRRGQSLPAAGFIRAFGLLGLHAQQHAQRAASLGGAERRRRGDDDAADGNGGCRQEPEQRFCEQRSHIYAGPSGRTASSGLWQN